ncbi:MAG: hypothetical protein ABJL44_15585 [Algibacter sp.]
MKTINKFITVILILLAFTFTTNMNALAGNGNVDGDTTGTNDIPGNCGHGPNEHVGNANCNKGSTSIPLDGGLSILLLGAAAFGIKKLRQK